MISTTASGFKVALAAGPVQPANSRLVPDFIEKPYQDIATVMAEFNDKLDVVGYWINPVNWWHEFGNLITSPGAGTFLIASTIVGFWFIAAGAKAPKKVLFWSWVVYWVMRGFVFI